MGSLCGPPLLLVTAMTHISIARAYASRLRLVWFLLGLTAVYFGWAFLASWSDGYVFNQIARRACVEMMKEVRWGSAEKDKMAEKRFFRQVRGMLRADFTRDNAELVLSKKGQKNVCSVEYAFRQKVEWPLVSELGLDVPPRSVVRRGTLVVKESE